MICHTMTTIVPDLLRKSTLQSVLDPDLADFVIVFTAGGRDPMRVDSTLESAALTGSARWGQSSDTADLFDRAYRPAGRAVRGCFASLRLH